MEARSHWVITSVNANGTDVAAPFLTSTRFLILVIMTKSEFLELMKAKVFKLGHVFDPEHIEPMTLDGEADLAECFNCINCDETFCYFVIDNTLIGGRAISNAPRFRDEPIIDVECHKRNLA